MRVGSRCSVPDSSTLKRATCWPSVTTRGTLPADERSHGQRSEGAPDAKTTESLTLATVPFHDCPTPICRKNTVAGAVTTSAGRSAMPSSDHRQIRPTAHLPQRRSRRPPNRTCWPRRAAPAGGTAAHRAAITPGWTWQPFETTWPTIQGSGPDKYWKPISTGSRRRVAATPVSITPPAVAPFHARCAPLSAITTTVPACANSKLNSQSQSPLTPW